MPSHFPGPNTYICMPSHFPGPNTYIYACPLIFLALTHIYACCHPISHQNYTRFEVMFKFCSGTTYKL
jgi:hypothetical protein